VPETEPTKLTAVQHAIGIMSRWPGPVRVTQQAVVVHHEEFCRAEIRLVDNLH
jgi:hypothetical protein